MEDERPRALVDRAERLGLQLEYDSGFVIVRRPAMPDQAASTFAETVIRELAAQLTEVGRGLLARCRNARGQEFLGRLAFGCDYDVLGTIAGCRGDQVDLRYRAAAGEERERESVGPARADSVLIISDAPDPTAASTGFPDEVTERFREFIERADRMGIRFWWDSGFVLASFGTDPKAIAQKIRMFDPPRAKSGLDSWIATVSPWAARMTEIRRLVLARARAVRGSDFVGARVFAPTIEAISPGYDAKGTINSFSQDQFIISTRDPWDREIALQCGCEHSLIVLDEQEPAQVSSPSATPKSETSAGGWLRRAFTGN